MEVDALQSAYAAATQAANIAVMRKILDQTKVAGLAAVDLIQTSGQVQQQAQAQAPRPTGATAGAVDILV